FLLLAACDALSNELADDAPYKMRQGGEEMLLTTPEDKVMTYNALIAALRLHDINVVEEA
ncbi:MAG: hypothetical protein HN879_09925, partial [Flavobacteriaceae bacterium]|nr:hypothetical protein [Flavobacteriaceae bacterium]